MSRRLADATSRFLAKRTPRRGFLTKTAVVGSALAVAPKDFVLKPGTAYAQVCNCNGSRCDCSQLCCDGYTEFCCTIYGTNGCPPGSLYGGWWRVSGSSYCGGSNRYYMDCHNPCGDCACGASGICSGSCNGTACGCALGSCRNRKAGCTHFRYGQCNRQMKCLGPIICRVVTCVAPWRLEPTCTTASRTDEATRNHNRACLSELSSPPTGELEMVDGRPGTIRLRGWAVDADTFGPVRINVYVNGNLITSAPADRSRPDVGAAYRSFGNDHGFDITIDSTTGTKEVCAEAVNEGGGNNQLLGCQIVRVSAGQPTGILEEVRTTAEGMEIRGWAVLPGDRDPVDVDLFVDDMHATSVTADRRRKDLATTLGTAGNKHGFKATLPLPEATSSEAATICARVTDPETGDEIPLGCLTTSLSGGTEPPHGAIDRIRGRANSIRVAGWALDPEGGDVEIVVLLNGRARLREPARSPRPDVAAIHPAAVDRGGFDFKFRADPGEHHVCVYAVGSDRVDGPMLGCATVTVG